MTRYVSVSLDIVLAEMPLPGELYLFIGGKFLRYKNTGDIISSDKYNEFVLKKIQYVFTTEEFVEKFETLSKKVEEKEKEQVIAVIGESNRDLYEEKKAIESELLGVFTSSTLSDDKCQEVQEKTRKFIDKMSTRKVSQQAILKMMSHGKTLSNHSTNVATLSVYLAYHLGYNHQIILENIYLGALFHDYGKTRVDSKILESGSAKDIEEAMKKHPELGKTFLAVNTTLPQEVLAIVLEHHEHHDGSGYPKKMKGGKIYDLTKIVSIANAFDNLVDKGTGDLRARQEQAIQALEQDQGKQFDPKKLEKCIQILKLGL